MCSSECRFKALLLTPKRPATFRYDTRETSSTLMMWASACVQTVHDLPNRGLLFLAGLPTLVADFEVMTKISSGEGAIPSGKVARGLSAHDQGTGYLHGFRVMADLTGAHDGPNFATSDGAATAMSGDRSSTRSAPAFSSPSSIWSMRRSPCAHVEISLGPDVGEKDRFGRSSQRCRASSPASSPRHSFNRSIAARSR